MSSIKPTPTVTVVLNVYKRSDNFSSQLTALMNQTVPITEYLVWENGEEKAPQIPGITVARVSKNLGVWARFAFALNAKSDYIWIIDDDAIPGRRFLENALKTHHETGGLVGSRGLRFRTTGSYALYDEFGPNNPNARFEEVDIVGHNWVFPRNWLSAFWSLGHEAFGSERAGEDIHLSYAIQQVLGVGTFVAPHPNEERELWGEQAATEAIYGQDTNAISKNPESLRKFEDAYRHYIQLGFNPLCSRVAESRPSYQDRLLSTALRINPQLVHRIAKRFGLRKR